MQIDSTPSGAAATADGAQDNTLASALQESLPGGSHVAVGWQHGSGPVNTQASCDAPGSLLNRARALLAQPPVAPAATRALHLCWTAPTGARAALAATLGETLGDEHCWLRLAQRLVDAELVAEQARARAASLEKSERLQQALYEIADLAGSELELSDMLRCIHHVIGGLMYAENLYIVLYDDLRDSMRFLYFCDSRDPFVADPGREVLGIDMPGSLTLAMLRSGEPMRGSSEKLWAQAGGRPECPSGVLPAGPACEDWLGVPVSREGRVCAAVVVQSYDRADVYGDEDRALLAFVAQHILTALERHQARGELERRVEERTHALLQSNTDLQAEIIERQRGERLQRALFRIAELSINSDTLERFYAQVHDVVSELIYARNFYIALLTEDGESLEFPYSIDERDRVRHSRRLAGGMTEYVIERGSALLADRHLIRELTDEGIARGMGTPSYCWLGVPLFRDDLIVGVIAVQSYSPTVVFTHRDQELMTFVAHHIGIGLTRKRAKDRLLQANAELEQRVDERTRELAEANGELLSQIGERVRAEQRLTYQARHDALTGLPNRSQLLECLAAAIGNAQSSPSRCFAVLFLDLDRFKLVNDSAGHLAGDELLVEVGRRIVRAVRFGDVVARLGGDEFAILIEDIDGLHVAEELAGRVLAELGQPCWVAGRELFPSASVGIAMWHPRYRTGAELLRDADAAMYRAKNGGRDRWMAFDEAMRDEAMRILDLEADLRRAINSDGFIAYYQPIVRLSDRRVIGHEALLRWTHRRGGLLTPTEFIGVGEDSGLIEEVDWLVYAQVAERLARTQEGYISVNVSPRHFRSDDFADRLLRLLENANADPQRLKIEITEVALLDESPRAQQILGKLRENGVMAQMDDFGTGFSALSYLHRFPIESLKIDQSFVAGLTGEKHMESVAVVRAIQALAGTLNITTVGEGIETEAQCNTLRELGCMYGQGYLFGRPQPQLVTMRLNEAMIT